MKMDYIVLINLNINLMKKNFKKIVILQSVILFSLLINSCDNRKLTVCDCMNPPDKSYEERCRKWFTNASHEEYVQMMEEKKKCK